MIRHGETPNEYNQYLLDTINAARNSLTTLNRLKSGSTISAQYNAAIASEQATIRNTMLEMVKHKRWRATTSWPDDTVYNTMSKGMTYGAWAQQNALEYAEAMAKRIEGTDGK